MQEPFESHCFSMRELTSCCNHAPPPCSNPHKGIERFGLPVFQQFVHYIWNDLFTTLLNAPRGRFILIFFLVYFVVVCMDAGMGMVAETS